MIPPPSLQGSDVCPVVVMELKLKALILDAVHNIDVVKLLIDRGVSSVNNWSWQKQLRFYLRNGMWTY